MTDLTRKPSILSVGRLYCDLIFADLPRMPTLGTEVYARDFGAHAGGGAFITAAHLAQLGHATSLAAMLPASPFADLMRLDLEHSKVDMSLCAPLSSADGPQITVALAQQADRSFITRRVGPSFPKVSAADIARRNIQHVHIGEIASLVSQPEIIDLARAQGATISVDCSWDEKFDAEPLRRVLGTVDIFLPNETEMQALQDIGIGTDVAPITVIKQGAQGATFISDQKAISAPALTAKVVDPTGAGDAFNAGFLSAWLAGENPKSCLEAGHKRGSMAVGRTGGFSAETEYKTKIDVPGE